MAHFPLNAWYAAAYDVELKRVLLPRTICNRKMVFYRLQDGSPAALEDACWHRLLPLSMGRLDGDDVVCGYHGLVFNPGGRCIHMPSQDTLNPLLACGHSRPSSAIASSGSGWAIPRLPMQS
jgi:phenylpropionate dioxygenase-like ring-hydroxylating dioxygenase large terminal subunit